MRFEIDQSGKIEDTAKNTGLALSNGDQYTVLIRRRTKRQLQEAFRRCGFIRLFIYWTFAAGIFFLVEHLKRPATITVDLEYPGKEKLISEILKKLFESQRKPPHDIRFSRIGNRPRVHYAAKDVFDGKKKADRLVSFEDIVRALKKADGRLRECLSTLVDALSQPSRKSIAKKAQKSTPPRHVGQKIRTRSRLIHRRRWRG